MRGREIAVVCFDFIRSPPGRPTKEGSALAYELLRPIVLYGVPAVQRAKETGEARNTFERKADAFATGRRSLPCGRLARIEWLLFLKLPDYTARKKPQREPDHIRLPLLGLDEDHTNAPEALG